MKLRLSNPFRSAALTAAGFAFSLCFSHAAPLTWDGNGSTAPNPNGGTGTWDVNTTANWWDGATNVVWPDLLLGGTNDDAVFANTAGTVSLATGGVTANDLTFNTTGYIIQTNTLTLNGTTPTITTGTGVTATINAAIAGGSIVKSGVGALTLGGTNTFSTLTVSQGAVALNSNGAAGASAAVILGDANTGANSPSVSFGATPTFATLTVASGITAATINSNAFAPTVSGVTTLNSPLTLNHASGNSGVQFGGNLTGNGGGSGNDSVIYSYAGSGNNYTQYNNTTANDYLGNFHIKTGTLALQFASNTANKIIPDTAMIIIDSGAGFTWNNGTGTALETIDGLSSNNSATGGSMGRNIPTYTLTINANNPDNDGKRIFTGNINSMTGVLTLGGNGTQEFSGATPSFSNVTNLDKGTLKLTKTTGWNSAVTFGASNTPTLQLNTPLVADTPWTFTKQLNGTNTGAKIEKVGLGTAILSPAASSSFAGSTTGALTVTGGKLYLNSAGFTAAPAVSVSDGATFGGTATAGPISVATGGTLEGGYNGVDTTLTAGDVTTSATATLKGTISTTAGYKPLAVTNLTINGGDQALLIDATGIGLTNGATYDLLVSANAITAPGATSVLASLKATSRLYTPVIDGTGKKIQVTYDANSSVYWTGAGGTAWNTAATSWKLSGNNNDTQFQANDVVFFHDSPVSAVVDISGADVNPSATTFDNTTTTPYTLQGSNGISTGFITKSNNGTVTITNANTTTGAVALNAGRIRVGNNSALGTGAITVTGGAISSDGATARSLPNSVILNGAATFGDTTDSGNLTWAGSLSGSAALTKTGAGALTFSGNGTYSGAISVSGGTLTANHANALGTGTASLVLGDSNTGANPVELKVDTAVAAVVQLASVTNSNFGTAQTITLNAGSSLPANNASIATTLNLNGTVPVTLKATNTGGHTTAQDMNWRIAGTGIPAGTTALILDGSTFALRISQLGNATAASNFTGDVLIKGNVTTQGRTYLSATAGNQNLNFINNDVTLNASSSWTLVWGGETCGALNGPATASVALSNQNALNNVGLTLGNNNRSGSFSGAIGGGFGVLKTGSGTQTFAGASSYSGTTTVNNGTLLVNNTTGSGTGSGAVTVTSPGILGGTGSISGAVTASGILAPGTTGTGTLTTGAITLTGTYQCQLDGANCDKLATTGTLTLTGATLAVSTIAAPTATSYVIATYTGLAPAFTTVTGLPAGYVVDTATAGQIKLVKGGYASWAATNAPTGTASDDYDGDGVSNALEWVLGGLAATKDFAKLPAVSTSGGNLLFTFVRNDAAWTSGDTTVRIEVGTTLASWPDSYLVGVDTASSSPGVTVTPNGETDTVTLSVPQTPDAKKFARLKVSVATTP